MSAARTEELERIAEDYHLNQAVPDKFIEDLCQEHCCQWLGTLISPYDRVLELGYGEGITLQYLAHLAGRYTVIEGAPSLAQVVRTKHPTVEVVESLFEDYSPTERFDKLLALHVFEHVDDPVKLGRRLREWLKPDGADFHDLALGPCPDLALAVRSDNPFAAACNRCLACNEGQWADGGARHGQLVPGGAQRQLTTPGGGGQQAQGDGPLSPTPCSLESSAQQPEHDFVTV